MGSTRVSLQDNQAVIEWTPKAYLRESVLDYVNLRGERASASSITRFLTTHTSRVIVAPTGNYGSIVEVIMRKAGDQRVSELSGETLSR